MAQPTPYNPSTDFIPFTNIGYVPGTQLNIEFSDLKTTLDQILANLALLQRDDTHLANGSVDFAQLSTNLATALSNLGVAVPISTLLTQPNTWTQTQSFPTINVSPAAVSLALGLNVTQSGPTTGSQSGRVDFNNIIVSSDQSAVTGAGNNASALNVQYTYGGSNTQGSKQGLYVQGFLTAATSGSSTNKSYVAGAFLQTASANDGGTNTGAGALGAHTALSGFINAQAAATNYKSFMGMELDVQMLSGSTATARFGGSFVSFGQVQGATYDAAIEVGAATATAWQNAMLLSKSWNGNAPVSTTGAIVKTEGSYAIGSVIDVSSLSSVANYIIKGPGSSYTVDGSGNTVSTGGFASFGGSVICQSALAIPAGGVADAGFRFSSTDAFGIFFGSGVPTLAAAKGSLYLRSDGTTTNDRAYINTNGGTTWTALTTVA